ncbi:MAG: hypothetical protein ACKN9E_06100 [Microcystaceae cyanobacterium]
MSELEKLNAIEILSESETSGALAVSDVEVLSESETAGTLKGKGAATSVELDYKTPLQIPKETFKTPRGQGKNEEYQVTVEFKEVGKDTYNRKETYSLLEYPPVKQDSLLAQYYRAEILDGLSLEKVVSGMISSADLINLAYWALYARETDPLAASLSALQLTLRSATSLANTTMGEFRTTSQRVAGLLADSFQLFTRVDEETTAEDEYEQEALLQLAGAAEEGKKMAQMSRDLADKFTAIINDCDKIIYKAIETKVNDAIVQAELKRKLDELQSLIKQTTTLQENLATSIQRAETDYQEAKDREETESDRAFWTGLAGSIFGGLSTAAGTAAGMYLAMKSPVGLPNAGGATGGSNTGTKPGATNDDNIASTSQKLKDANKELLAIQQEQSDNETTIKEAQAIIDSISDDDAKKDKNKKEARKEANGTKATAVGKREGIKERLAAAQKYVDQLVTGTFAVGESFNQLSQNTFNAAAEASRQKMEFYKQKIKLEDENRKALSDIALYTSQVQYTTNDVEKTKTAIQSLEFAITALNRVVVALTETERFWQSLATFCENRLASTAFAEKVKRFTQKTSATARMKDYRDESGFVLPALQTIAYWVAVNNVSNEYQVAVHKVYTQVLNDINNRPKDVETAQKGLKGLANKVLAATNAQETTINMNMDFYKEQLLQHAVAYSVNNPALNPKP